MSVFFPSLFYRNNMHSETHLPKLQVFNALGFAVSPAQDQQITLRVIVQQIQETTEVRM